MSVTAAKGFRAAGVSAGLRAGSNAPDVAVVVNDGRLQSAAGVFTSNRFKAAPVLWSQQVLASGEVHAVLLNAGGANACTGPDGFADTHRSAEELARLLGCGAAEIAVCSTGLIGERLPIKELLAGAADAVAELTVDGGALAAEAIRTTDTKAKQARRMQDGVVVGGMAKGAGMLAPALATMLCVITTDAIAEASVLDRVLRTATAISFDRLDADGCMSTNDTVLLLASGESGVAIEEAGLAMLVSDVCADLADQLLRDAEGASKFVAIEVRGAMSQADALTAARTISRSNLLKCAIHGSDPNWGRVLSALGTSDAAFEPDQVDVAINDVWICRAGAAADSRDLVDMSGTDVHILVDLGAGNEAATIHTTDLTADYVHENSAYSS